jgi:hypothetical protein
MRGGVMVDESSVLSEQRNCTACGGHGHTRVVVDVACGHHAGRCMCVCVCVCEERSPRQQRTEHPPPHEHHRHAMASWVSPLSSSDRRPPVSGVWTLSSGGCIWADVARVHRSVSQCVCVCGHSALCSGDEWTTAGLALRWEDGKGIYFGFASAGARHLF